jgi:hypothetical protein
VLPTSKCDKIRAAWVTGDQVGALRIAARFFDRSDATKAFKRGMDAHTDAVAVCDNFFRALAAPARLSRRPAGMSWRGSGNVHGQSQSTQFHPGRSRTPSKVGASRRSGCNVENRCTKQSENNETERGLRVVLLGAAHHRTKHGHRKHCHDYH